MLEIWDSSRCILEVHESYQACRRTLKMTESSAAGITMPQAMGWPRVSVKPVEDAELDRQIRLLYMKHGAGLAAFVEQVQEQLRDSQARVHHNRVRSENRVPTGS